MRTRQTTPLNEVITTSVRNIIGSWLLWATLNFLIYFQPTDNWIAVWTGLSRAGIFSKLQLYFNVKIQNERKRTCASHNWRQRELFKFRFEQFRRWNRNIVFLSIHWLHYYSNFNKCINVGCSIVGTSTSTKSQWKWIIYTFVLWMRIQIPTTCTNDYAILEALQKSLSSSYTELYANCINIDQRE